MKSYRWMWALAFGAMVFLMGSSAWAHARNAGRAGGPGLAYRGAPFHQGVPGRPGGYHVPPRFRHHHPGYFQPPRHHRHHHPVPRFQPPRFGHRHPGYLPPRPSYVYWAPAPPGGSVAVVIGINP